MSKQKTGSSKKNNAGIKVEAKEYDFRIVALGGFILSFIILVFTYKNFGAYFESNDDARYVMAMKGFATPKPYDNFVSVYKFTVSIYIYLYQHFPSVGWYGYSMFLLLWGALFNIFISIYLLAKNRINFFLILLLFVFYYIFSISHNVIWINFTRPAIIVTATFILLLGVLYIHSDILKKNKWILIFPVITYAFGHFTRLDAGYLGFMLGIISATLIVSFHKKPGPFLLKYMLPVFAFILIVKFSDVFSQSQSPRNKEFLEKTEIIRQVLDFGNTASYVPNSPKDSAAFNALMTARYCSDTAVMTTDFLKKLKTESNALDKGNTQKFDDEMGIFLGSLPAENLLVLNLNIGFFILMFIWLISSFKNNRKKFSLYVLYQFFFIALIVGIAYYMKLPQRIYEPLLSCFTLVNMLILFSVLIYENRRLYYLISIPVLLVVIAYPKFIGNHSYGLTESKRLQKSHQRIFNNMNNYSNTVFIPLPIRSWELHLYTDPIKEINFTNNNSYVYLSVELSLAPETQDQLVDKFGTADHSKLFDNISKMDNVIFISDGKYNGFLRKYYHSIYNQDYYFEKIESDSTFLPESTGLFAYRLRK